MLSITNSIYGPGLPFWYPINFRFLDKDWFLPIDVMFWKDHFLLYDTL
jgi:hypothetical protein